MKIIDTHTHVYSDDEVHYPTISDPTRPPAKTGAFPVLERVGRENGVSHFCVVQPSSFYGWDNRFICDLALAEQQFAAGICTLNPDDDATPTLVPILAKQSGIRGIRSIGGSDGRLDHSGVRALWKACDKANLPINVFVKHEKAEELIHMLEDFRRTPCVIDHCLLLAAGPEESRVLNSILRLSRFPNTYAKLTFLSSGSQEEYPYRDLHGACRKIIAAFTPARCIWGSNFPCELWSPKSSYRQNVDLFRAELGLDAQTQHEIFWNTPWRLWFQGRSDVDSPSQK
jgi:predicted TIM-barrel fold metal-dependent hydrolase